MWWTCLPTGPSQPLRSHFAPFRATSQAVRATSRHFAAIRATSQAVRATSQASPRLPPGVVSAASRASPRCSPGVVAAASPGFPPVFSRESPPPLAGLPPGFSRRFASFGRLLPVCQILQAAFQGCWEIEEGWAGISSQKGSGEIFEDLWRGFGKDLRNRGRLGGDFVPERIW